MKDIKMQEVFVYITPIIALLPIITYKLTYSFIDIEIYGIILLLLNILLKTTNCFLRHEYKIKFDKLVLANVMFAILCSAVLFFNFSLSKQSAEPYNSVYLSKYITILFSVILMILTVANFFMNKNNLTFYIILNFFWIGSSVCVYQINTLVNWLGADIKNYSIVLINSAKPYIIFSIITALIAYLIGAVVAVILRKKVMQK